ncbi:MULTISPECIES: RadC family protein [Betaproteobacteria]|uniref:DNA repair protein RadC n=2 Tax=Comamonadaceae TaxID=80864 RepID=F4GH09_ALIDK|nr:MULTISPECIES: DNA repair protein RadC [Betaproteobacteria]MBP7966090.1 DNA repair protein RadC [Burkholderiaceae bacterium]MDN8056757.1 DNA repair protein RadC [Burkholderia multivorans]TXH12047.1 MAG: DNA repair protein RadC [Gammaproteobacteria bacterium]AEB87129.1 DNA repair protein RadC [Alicycliphilus denitrificans K601]ANC47625.1 DNA repair protein [Pandoraea pnomenusa]
MTASHIDLFTIDDNGQFQLASAGQVIEAALAILDEKVMRNGLISAPADASAFFSLRLGSLEHEVFAAIFLDAQNRVIEYIELFRGTLTQTSVYPREVVKTSLRLNAAAVIFAHNHPSGVPEPSRADENLTKVLKDALALVDVRVLDHVVVAGGASVSFAQRGLL